MAERILLVNRFFGGSQTPTGRMLQDVATALTERGHYVEVLTSDGDYVTSNDRLEQLDGVRVRQLWTPRRGRLAPWLAFLLQAAIRVPCSRWDRVVVLTDPPFLLTVGLLTPKGRRKIYYWTMDLYPEALAAHGMLRSHGPLYRGLRALHGAALRKVDGVVTLGSCQSARLRTYRAWPGDSPTRHIEVPPWDYRPLAKVEPANSQLRAEHGWQAKKIVLYAGNLGEAHSYAEVVDAARLLAERAQRDWLFVFVARGARRAALLEAAAGLENVVVLDYLPPERTADLLWSADVHLITMRPGWEGIVVPSKLYGVLMTDAPVLFIGPTDADTATELAQLGRGVCLAPGASGAEVVDALRELSTRAWGTRRPARNAPERIAAFIAGAADDGAPS